MDAVDESLVQMLADGSSGELNPVAAYLGGMVAQEAVKSTGKFHPIFQWYYFDASECAPAINSIPAAERQVRASGKFFFFFFLVLMPLF